MIKRGWKVVPHSNGYSKRYILIAIKIGSKWHWKSDLLNKAFTTYLN